MSYDGVGPADLARRLRATSCLSLAKVTSTLDIIHEMAAEGAPGGTVVIADEQVAGRGRLGRRWNSPPKTGIWLGYLVRTGGSIGIGVLSIRVGLKMVETLSELGAEAFLKWPNDLIASGRKLAGVLCEARWLRDRLQWLAIGIGMNVHGELPSDLAKTAIALDGLLPNVTRLEVLERLVPKLHRMSHAEFLTEDELRAFEASDWLRDRGTSAPIAGIVRGVDSAGALMVETRDGLERVIGGSVVLS